MDRSQLGHMEGGGAGTEGWNYVLKEMTFNQLLNSLKEGSIDLSIEGFFVTAERATWMHYSFPFGNTRLAVAMFARKGAHPWVVAMKIFFLLGNL